MAEEEPVRLALADERATETLGRRLGTAATPPLVISLSGPLGAGKTTLARGFIRASVGAEIEVPSPTFTLVQTYDGGQGTIWHFDLYRLRHPDEVWELGLEEALARSIALIEWPERLGGGALPGNGLAIALAPKDGGREAVFTADGCAALLVAALSA